MLAILFIPEDAEESGRYRKGEAGQLEAVEGLVL